MEYIHMNKDQMGWLLLPSRIPQRMGTTVLCWPRFKLVNMSVEKTCGQLDQPWSQHLGVLKRCNRRSQTCTVSLADNYPTVCLVWLQSWETRQNFHGTKHQYLEWLPHDLSYVSEMSTTDEFEKKWKTSVVFITVTISNIMLRAFQLMRKWLVNLLEVN